MRTLTARRWAVTLVILGLICAGSALVGLAVGGEWISPWDLLVGGDEERFILRVIRLPRVLVGIFVGGALAACGTAFQALLRNPLASPFVLGVSGGGSLGAVLAIVLGLEVIGLPARPLFAFLGCLLALVVIYLVAREGGRLVPQTLLLAGVVSNAFFLSLLGFLHFMASPHEAQEILRWMMGGLYDQRMSGALLTGFLTVGGTIWLSSMARDLNVLTLGEETASQLGVRVARARRRVFVLASVMTGAAVAVAGPIGFVGLFVPHGVRLVVGSDHRLLVPASFLAGGAVLVLADAVGRVVASPGELPVGLITAVLGAPCFLVLLVRGRRTWQ